MLITMSLVSLLLARRRLLLADQVSLGQDAAAQAAREELEANTKAIGIDRFGRIPRLVVDGALRGIAGYESLNYRLPNGLRWLTWPFVGLTAVGIALYWVRTAGLRGALALGLFPLALLAAATAGITYSLLLEGSSRSGLRRVAVATLAGCLSVLVLFGPCILVLGKAHVGRFWLMVCTVGAIWGGGLEVIDLLGELIAQRVRSQRP